MPRRFRLEEASRLLPQASRLLERAVALKSELDRVEKEIGGYAARVSASGGMMVDREHVLERRNRREAAVNQLQQALLEIQDLGCLVKDLDSGLLDFPTLFHGMEVCLCWKLGEPAIEYWHGMEEGFRGRKAIDQDFLDHHEGEQE
jgi:hypothetical protein